jgi:hypothetical protein
MNSKDEILTRLDALIQKADNVLRTHKPNPPNVIGFPTLDFEAFSEWQTQSIAYLSNLLGSDHIYVQKFKDEVKNAYTSHVATGKGILKGVREDIEGGYLKRIEALLSADIFSDFLEMAEYLLKQGYKDPAASLIGAVLEDGLQRICSNQGITVKLKEDISSLNKKLADNDVYNRLTQKKLQVWNDVRNNADHGNFDEYGIDDVKDMLKGVQDFLESYLQ